MRTLDELRGSLASFKCAAKRSSGGSRMFSVVAFSAARLAAYCATIFSRLAFRLIWLFFAMLSLFQFMKGNWKPLRSALASASVFAEVLTMMSMPHRSEEHTSELQSRFG